MKLGGGVWCGKAVVRAHCLATVAAIEAISHLFTDIFGQFVAVLYCQEREALACIETFMAQGIAGAGIYALVAVAAKIALTGRVVA